MGGVTVVRLSGPADPNEYQQEMASLLKTVIAEIESGRAVAYAIVTVTADAGCVTRWMMEGHTLATIGAVARLHTEIAG